MKMNREEWIAEADRILQEDYNFDPKFAKETADGLYETNLQDGMLDDEDGDDVRSAIDEELSYWGELT